MFEGTKSSKTGPDPGVNKEPVQLCACEVWFCYHIGSFEHSVIFFETGLADASHTVR